MTIDRNARDSRGLVETEAPVPVDRRRALIRLGLAVGAAYVAPTVLSIDRSAHAMGGSCAKNPRFC